MQKKQCGISAVTLKDVQFAIYLITKLDFGK